MKQPGTETEYSLRCRTGGFPRKATRCCCGTNGMVETGGLPAIKCLILRALPRRSPQLPSSTLATRHRGVREEQGGVWGKCGWASCVRPSPKAWIASDAGVNGGSDARQLVRQTWSRYGSRLLDRRLTGQAVSSVLPDAQGLAGPDHVGVGQPVQLRQRGHRSAVGGSDGRQVVATLHGISLGAVG